MAVIGIESSAHTFGVGIVEKGKILANEKMMYPISDKGIIPAKVSEYHAKNASTVIRRALSAAHMGLGNVEAVGYTKGPGLGPCLEIGMLAAKTLHEKLGIPIYPVNHAVAHIEITKHLSGFADPMVLYVSGGNSQILSLAGGHYHVHGETLDIGVGNMLDNFARAAGMKPAWGSTVAKFAAGGRYVKLPYTVKGMDFTFTGLLTAAIKLLPSSSVADVSFSMQETAFSMLVEATERALLLNGKDSVILCGGVAQSLRLREMLATMSASHKKRFYVADNQFNADNGAMIAYVAERMKESGCTPLRSDLTINQKFRIETAGVP